MEHILFLHLMETANQVLATNGSGTLSFTSAAAGDVVGPASSTDNAVVRFDSTTGKLIKNSTVIMDNSGNTSFGDAFCSTCYS
jgi:hypothetical protein